MEAKVLAEVRHPWDVYRDEAGGTCDIMYEVDSSWFLNNGYEWHDKEEAWKIGGKWLWICKCWEGRRKHK